MNDAGFSGDLRSSLLDAIEHDGRRVELALANLITHFFARMSYGLIRFIIGVLGISNRK